MKIEDVVLLRNIEQLFSADDVTLTQTTHLYLQGQCNNLNMDDELKLIQCLAKCSKLVSINLSNNNFDQLAMLISVLSKLTQLTIVNIRNCNIDSAALKIILPNNDLHIIDSSSKPYELILYDLIIQRDWTYEELMEMLLVGMKTSFEYPTINTFNHKLVNTLLPFTVLIAGGQPFLVLPTNWQYEILFGFDGIGIYRKQHNTITTQIKISDIIYDVIVGPTLESQLMLQASKHVGLAKKIRIQNALATMIAIIFARAQNNSLSDITPQNIIFSNNNLADLIDNNTYKLIDVNDENNYVEYAEASACGKIIQMILAPGPNMLNGNDDADITAIISKLTSRDYDSRISIEDAYHKLAEKFRNLSSNVLLAKFSYYMEQILIIIYNNNTADQWLSHHIGAHLNEQYMRSLRHGLLRTTMPQELKISDVFYAQLILEIVKLFAACQNSLPPALIVQINNIMRRIHGQPTINATIASTYSAEITDIRLRIDHCYNVLLNEIIFQRDEIIRTEPSLCNYNHIGAISILANKLRALNIYKQPLEYILLFAMQEINEIVESIKFACLAKDSLRVLQQKLQNYLHEFCITSTCQIPLVTNLMLNKAPDLFIIDVTRIYPVEVIEEVLPNILNDTNDSANLGAYIPCFYKMQNIDMVDKLVEAGAKSIYYAISIANHVLVEEFLRNGVDLFANKYNYKTPLDVAFDQQSTPGSLKVLETILEYIPQDKLNYLDKQLESVIQRVELGQLNVILSFMARRQDRFADILSKTLTTMTTSDNTILIKHIIKQGIDPFINLQPPETKKQKYKGCFPKICYANSISQTQSYEQFADCRYNLFTYAIQHQDQDLIAHLVEYMEDNEETKHQLGYHLVIAASQNQQKIVETLMRAGANTDCVYPSAPYKNHTTEMFAEMYNFSANFERVKLSVGSSVSLSP